MTLGGILQWSFLALTNHNGLINVCTFGVLFDLQKNREDSALIHAINNQLASSLVE